jgi:hypothetical protein
MAKSEEKEMSQASYSIAEHVGLGRVGHKQSGVQQGGKF